MNFEEIVIGARYQIVGSRQSGNMTAQKFTVKGKGLYPSPNNVGAFFEGIEVYFDEIPNVSNIIPSFFVGGIDQLWSNRICYLPVFGKKVLFVHEIDDHLEIASVEGKLALLRTGDIAFFCESDDNGKIFVREVHGGGGCLHTLWTGYQSDRVVQVSGRVLLSNLVTISSMSDSFKVTVWSEGDVYNLLTSDVPPSMNILSKSHDPVIREACRYYAREMEAESRQVLGTVPLAIIDRLHFKLPLS